MGYRDRKEDIDGRLDDLFNRNCEELEECWDLFKLHAGCDPLLGINSDVDKLDAESHVESLNYMRRMYKAAVIVKSMAELYIKDFEHEIYTKPGLQEMIYRSELVINSYERFLDSSIQNSMERHFARKGLNDMSQPEKLALLVCGGTSKNI